ncbi:MAG: hypothetical protein H6835_16470 [Planctomycetes bacterium]|nr:hypothetical protein [Planctomycetota bacterium]
MADIVCPRCKRTFDGTDPANRIGPWAAGALLGGVGMAWGAHVGIASAGWGIPATVPLGLIGLFIGGTSARLFRRCPHCGHKFRL